MTTYFFRMLIKGASIRIAACVFTCFFNVLVPFRFECFASPEVQSINEAIHFNYTGSPIDRPWIVSDTYKIASDWYHEFIELFTFVAPDSKPVADNEAENKNENVNYDTLLQYLPPVFYFLLGLFFGYSPFDTVDKKKPISKTTR